MKIIKAIKDSNNEGYLGQIGISAAASPGSLNYQIVLFEKKSSYCEVPDSDLVELSNQEIIKHKSLYPGKIDALVKMALTPQKIKEEIESRQIHISEYDPDEF